MLDGLDMASSILVAASGTAIALEKNPIEIEIEESLVIIVDKRGGSTWKIIMSRVMAESRRFGSELCQEC